MPLVAEVEARGPAAEAVAAEDDDLLLVGAVGDAVGGGLEEGAGGVGGGLDGERGRGRGGEGRGHGDDECGDEELHGWV